jgi:hypothetical protein
MIRQLDSLTILITFTFVKRLGEPFIKASYTLHVKKLNLQNKMKHLEFVHIKKLIQIDPITCSKYYEHKTFCFHTLFKKNPFFWAQIYDSFLSETLKTKIVNMTMAFYGLNVHPYMELIEMKK